VKLVTWNVNSLKQRLPRLLAMIERHQPDVVLLQETKVEDVQFPTMELVAAGYECATFGQRAYNGVAILSRVGLKDVRYGFDGDPAPAQSRVISAVAGDLRVIGIYVINGKAVGDPAYELKLAWLDALRVWLGSTFDPDDPLVIAGDFNIAPDDRDVWDPDLWRGSNLASEPERGARGAPGLGPDGPGTSGGGRCPGAVLVLGLHGGCVPQGLGSADRPGARDGSCRGAPRVGRRRPRRAQADLRRGEAVGSRAGGRDARLIPQTIFSGTTASSYSASVR
jgi:Endonuclease/Exonuclease/phosphatase family